MYVCTCACMLLTSLCIGIYNTEHRSLAIAYVHMYVCMYYMYIIYICICICYWRLMLRDLHYRTFVFSQYHMCNTYVYNMYIYIMYKGRYVPVYVYMVITRIYIYIYICIYIIDMRNVPNFTLRHIE